MIQLARKAIRNPLVVAYTALFLAITGGSAAFAAATIGSADIIDGSVQSVDIHNKGVKQADLQPAEAWHQVGAAGEPPFGSYDDGLLPWRNETFGDTHQTAGFYRDPYGIVHVKGTVCVDAAPPSCFLTSGGPHFVSTIFTLPAGYHPERKSVFAVMSQQGAVRVDVHQDGSVALDGNDVPLWLALDGISFRCAPSGSNGCP
jgi:hypothetical protein